MGVEFTFTQLIPLVFIVVTGWSLYKRYFKLSGVMAGLVILSLFFMPVKLTQSNISRFEDSGKFDNVPEKVVVKKSDFESFQNSQYDELKKESKNEKF